MEYQDAKALAASQDEQTRRELARKPEVRPEILYFLASDREPSVRRAVATNAATPRHADLILAKDADVAVREDLARKIDQLIPDLAQTQQRKIRDLTMQVIALLARDQAVRVRKVVAETLKDFGAAPRELIQQLARDLEIQVAGPVLRHSPVLTDDDLLDIIVNTPIKGALTAIAQRRGIVESVSEGIAKAAAPQAPAKPPYEPAAIAALLANPTAQIREDTLDLILEQAPEQPAWHQPLIERPTMPKRALTRLAEFVSQSLLAMLQARPDLDADSAEAIAKTVKRRLQAEVGAGGEAPVGEEAIAAAIAAGKREAVTAALARDSGLPPSIVDKVLASKSAKAVTALVWRAKLSMRQALQVQLRLAGIPPTQALNPRGGSDYPLTPSEMEWQLELFGAN